MHGASHDLGAPLACLVDAAENLELLVKRELEGLTRIAVDKEVLDAAADLPSNQIVQVLEVNLPALPERRADLGQYAGDVV